jgi:hypothetical protein
MPLKCPPRHPTELAPGYAARMAALFRCASAREFCSDFGFSFLGVARGRDSDLEELASLTGTDLGELTRFAPVHRPDGSYVLCGEVLAAHVSNRTSIHVCAECVADDIVAAAPGMSADAVVWWRRDWTVSGIDTCTRHRRPLALIVRNSGSGRQFDAAWALAEITSQLDALLDDPVRRDATEYQAYVTARLDGAADPMAIFSALPLHLVITACAKFGNLSLNGAKPWREVDEHGRHDAYQEGYAILTRGQAGIAEMLWRRFTSLQDVLPDLIGAASLLEAIYPVLTTTKGDPVLDDLRHATANAVYDVLPFSPESEPLFGVPCTRRRSYAVAEASRHFRLTEKTIKLYAEASGVAERVGTPDGRTRLWIDAAKADSFFGESGGFINLAKIEEETGARAPSLQAFVDGGLLAPLETERLRQRMHRPVRRVDVATLMQKFLDRAEPVAAAPAGSIALTEIHHQVRGALSVIHSLALSGEIWLGSVTGLLHYASLVVNLEEVRGKLGGTSGELLNSLEASAVAGVSVEAWRKLASLNLVETATSVNPATGMRKKLYRPEVPLRFRGDFISLYELSHMLKCRNINILADLQQRGITTALDEGAIGVRLYRRLHLRSAGLIAN